MVQQLPKVLILSRGVWDDTRGTSSTLTNLFQDYDADKLAHVYIESTLPNTKCCYRFFQISEFSLVHKLYKWKTKTGHAIDMRLATEEPVDAKIADQEASVLNYVRGHRSVMYSFARDILWWFNGWKSKELKQFVLDFDADVIWIDSSPLPLMNRLYNYVLKIVKKPAVIFMQDDIYTYESCGNNFFAKIRKCYLRKFVRRVVNQCDNMFVASPKMKQEYDKIFGINSTFIAKSIDFGHQENKQFPQIHHPIRLVYLGQVIYGRIYSLIAIANALAKLNSDGVKAQLYIYTNNQISENLKKQLLINDSVFLMPPVPYTEVPEVMSKNDVVVFVESFEPRFCKVARLSFSTKICDYLGSGKCILAIGPADLAPIEYFKQEDAALVATNENEIEVRIKELANPEIVQEYVQKAYNCAVRNHDRKRMNEVVYGKIIKLSNY